MTHDTFYINRSKKPEIYGDFRLIKCKKSTE